LSLPIRTVSTSTTVGIKDFTIIWAGSTGGQTATLPKAVDAEGRIYAFVSVGTVAFSIVRGSVSDTVDGGPSYNLAAKGNSVIIQSDGISAWYVLTSA
jgi:hypothetical protein